MKTNLFMANFGADVFSLSQPTHLTNIQLPGIKIFHKKDLFNMPKTMAQLAVVKFFSWFALYAMWIYTTLAVTSHTYGTN